MYFCICIYVHVHVHVYMYVCMDVCMYVYIYIYGIWIPDVLKYRLYGYQLFLNHGAPVEALLCHDLDRLQAKAESNSILRSGTPSPNLVAQAGVAKGGRDLTFGIARMCLHLEFWATLLEINSSDLPENLSGLRKQ